MTTPFPALRTFSVCLRSDRRGITIVEFAMVAPVMCLLLLGAFDIAHTLYMNAALQGAIQQAARSSGLEAGADPVMQHKLDDDIKAVVKKLAGNADIDIYRRFYRTFEDAAAAKAEDWTDLNANEVCDNGEPFDDANLNGVWDEDGADEGQGGARDATVYTVEVSYPRMFPIDRFIGGSDRTSMSAVTVLRNQPYGDQGSYAASQKRNCP